MDTSKQYNTCSVIRRTVSIVGGIQQQSETTIYSNIPCYTKIIRGEITIGQSQNDIQNKRKFIVDLAYNVQDGDVIVFEGKRYEVSDHKHYSLIPQGNLEFTTKCT